MSALADRLVEQALYLPPEMSKLFLEISKEIRRLEKEAKAAVVVREGAAVVAICPKCDDVRVAKRCPLCERDLPIEEFARDKGRRFGRSTYCKLCWRAIKRYGGVESARQAMDEWLSTEVEQNPMQAGVGG